MPDDWGAEDWELDDWEDESFDEDVWDTTQLDLEDEHWLGDEHDGGGGLWTERSAEAPVGGGVVRWSAWEIGTAFALGGWLADRHAEEVGRQVREALHPTGAGMPGDRAPRRAPYPAPPSGYPYLHARGMLRVGEPLDQGALFTELAAACAEGRDWLVQAEARPDGGRLLVLVISAVPVSAGPRLWVVAEGAANGFSPARLVPVFRAERDAGLAVFATDEAHEAADAAAWAAVREGVNLTGFTVTERR